MSRRALACLGVFVVAACSLTSTSGLSGGAEPAAGGDGGSAALDGALEATSDAVADVARDAAKDPSLVAEYSFEDGAGSSNALDTSGNEKHGLVQGDASFIASGVRGRSLSFSGTGFFVVNALSGSFFPHTGTLSLWFRYDFAPSAADNPSVFDNWDKGRSHLFVRYPNGASIPGQFQMAMQPPTVSGDYAAVAGFSPQRNKWTHVVMTWNETAGEAAFYFDGVALGRQVYDKAFVPTEQLFRMGEGLVGAVDEVRLFRRAFTEAEALALD